VHRVLGTAGAVRKAIAALGYDVTMQEWFDYDGDPYKFRITVNLDQQPLTTPDYLMLQRTALDAKNVRSFFEGFSAKSTQPGSIRYGFGFGQTISATYQPLVPPVYETRVRAGAGIGMAPANIKAIFQPLQ
jgi:P2-related tail formation protein